MKPLVDEEEVDPLEAQLPEVLDGVHHVAAQPGGVVDQDQIKGPGLEERRLHEALQTVTALDTGAAHCLVCVDLVVEDGPISVPRRFLTTVSNLVCDRLGPLLIATVPSVDR